MIYDLILEGGGTRSITFLGALQEIEARGHTPGRMLGTSAGSISTTLLACGYNSHEIAAALYDQQSGQPTFNRLIAEPPRVTREDMRKGHLRGMLRDFRTPLVPDFAVDQFDTLLFDILLKSELLRPLLAFVELGYWCSDQPFLDWLASLLDAGSFHGQPRHFSHKTLREFYAAIGSELSLVVSDVTDAHVLILNHRTAPHCPLLSALRMSCSVLLLWEPVTWRDAWGAYLEHDISGHTIVDGQLFSPFPIELLLSDSPQVTCWLGPKQTPNVLGLVLDTTSPVPGAPAPEPESRWSYVVDRLPSARALVGMVDSAVLTRLKLTIQAVDRRIIRLPAKGYGMMETQLSLGRVDALVKAGREAAHRYFEHLVDFASPAADDPLMSLTSPGAVQYIDDTPRQQIAYVGMINYYNIDTQGGSYIGGSVITGGGDFTGRDNLAQQT